MLLLSAKISILRFVVRALLLTLALVLFTFASLSGAGAGQFNDGFGAILRNLPNALPWLVLFVLVYIAFRWELLGGGLIVFSGLASIVFFNAFATPIVLFVVSLPLIGLGCLLIICWILSRPNSA